MAEKDTYLTISGSSKGLFKDRGSRFIAIASHVTTQDDIKELLDGYRKEYHDARHHCYAWVLGSDRALFRANDDGEPSGTAGKPILGQITSGELTNILVIVIRYFGGTLLGTSGLINAYRSAAADAIANAKITECTLRSFYRLKFPYTAMNDVMKIVKDEELLQSEQAFELDCSMKIGFRLSSADHILKRLSGVRNLHTEFIETV
jgi:uncharacterized YigZ family protein